MFSYELAYAEVPRVMEGFKALPDFEVHCDDHGLWSAYSAGLGLWFDVHCCVDHYVRGGELQSDEMFRALTIGTGVLLRARKVETILGFLGRRSAQVIVSLPGEVA